VIQSDERTVQKDTATGLFGHTSPVWAGHALLRERQNNDGDGVGQVGGLAEKKAHCVVSKGVLCGKLVAKAEYTILCMGSAALRPQLRMAKPSCGRHCSQSLGDLAAPNLL